MRALRRARSLGLGLLLAPLALLVFQTQAAPLSSALDRFALELLTPPQRWVDRLSGGVSGWFDRFFRAGQLVADNQRLRKRLARLELEQRRADALRREIRHLEALLELRREQAAPALGARVLAKETDSLDRSIVIDRGREDGLRANLPVLGARGLVGRVVQVAGRSARVQLLVDRRSGVAATVPDRAIYCILSGDGDQALQVKHVYGNVWPQPGQVLWTSGLDRLYPADLRLGVVRRRPAQGGETLSLEVRLGTDLLGLDEVLVMLLPEKS
ncbi:MAG TPA: rod shape-determining protein MreC [Acidobacteriota bacterium]|jgi:rod shape-determining protein MreC